MKRIKTIATTFLLAAALVLLPGSNALKAEAATPVTYAVQYDSEDNEWRYQVGSQYTDEGEDRSLYYLLQVLKDGDLVAVYNSDDGAPHLDLGNVKLSNLTLCNTAMTAVHTGGISDCHILSNSTCAINGDVHNAFVYDAASVNFNNNVHNLTILSDEDNFYSNVNCGGTVWHLYAYSTTHPVTFYDLYNFDSGVLVIDNGVLETEYYFYDESIPSGNAQTATPAPSTPSAPADEYDEVPKTGESALPYALLSVSVLCFAGSLMLRKKAN